MAPVKQQGEVSWSMVCAACCHIALVFAIMHCFCPFHFYTLKKNLVLINRRNGPRYQRVPALCSVLTGEIPKGLIRRNFVFDVVYLYMYIIFLCGFVSRLILWFLDNLWFDGLRAE